jgi:hypothetical protein
MSTQNDNIKVDLKGTNYLSTGSSTAFLPAWVAINIFKVKCAVWNSSFFKG